MDSENLLLPGRSELKYFNKHNSNIPKERQGCIIQRIIKLGFKIKNIKIKIHEDKK
ncbi:MAG: hypothetical protein LBK13_10530 [Spirochaetales bacterium]|jgi:hypothetical protein|nr:hypothetical protein [Spirochaetales bacterium]